jgi:hypothetical protein
VVWKKEEDAMTTVTAEKKMDARIVDLAMTPEEAEELRLALERALVDLHTEIAHTDRYEFREILKKRRAILQGMLRRLSARPSGATTPGLHTEAQ